MLTLEEGALLVKAARESVKRFFKDQNLEIKKTKNRKLNEKHGIFVTIKKFSDHSLRGCIGFISPLPVYESVQRAAIAAAFEDPRFKPLERDELDDAIFEVSILAEPEELKCKPKDYKKHITIGKDGLIIRCGSHSSLLLPQVWKEIPDLTSFLEILCNKAGVTSDYLYDKNTKLYKFKVQAFVEIEPKGRIAEFEEVL